MFRCLASNDFGFLQCCHLLSGVCVGLPVMYQQVDPANVAYIISADLHGGPVCKLSNTFCLSRYNGVEAEGSRQNCWDGFGILGASARS